MIYNQSSKYFDAFPDFLQREGGSKLKSLELEDQDAVDIRVRLMVKSLVD